MAEVDLTKKKQREIKKEIKRLEEVYKDIDVKRKDLLPGLIENAAFTRITLKYLAEDLKENGTTEMFSQSENQTPYSRRRPEADLYNTMTGNYLKFIKQLDAVSGRFIISLGIGGNAAVTVAVVDSRTQQRGVVLVTLT